MQLARSSKLAGSESSAFLESKAFRPSKSGVELSRKSVKGDRVRWTIVLLQSPDRALGISGGRNMANSFKRPLWLAVMVGVGLSSLSGCQTYFPETGQTLPSGHYLQHLPQYIPPTPAFPLPREESSLEQAYTQQQPKGP
jgi:hypothetical protein